MSAPSDSRRILVCGGNSKVSCFSFADSYTRLPLDYKFELGTQNWDVIQLDDRHFAVTKYASPYTTTVFSLEPQGTVTEGVTEGSLNGLVDVSGTSHVYPVLQSVCRHATKYCRRSTAFCTSRTYGTCGNSDEWEIPVVLAIASEDCSIHLHEPTGGTAIGTLTPPGVKTGSGYYTVAHCPETSSRSGCCRLVAGRGSAIDVYDILTSTWISSFSIANGSSTIWGLRGSDVDDYEGIAGSSPVASLVFSASGTSPNCLGYDVARADDCPAVTLPTPQPHNDLRGLCFVASKHQLFVSSTGGTARLFDLRHPARPVWTSEVNRNGSFFYKMERLATDNMGRETDLIIGGSWSGKEQLSVWHSQTGDVVTRGRRATVDGLSVWGLCIFGEGRGRVATCGEVQLLRRGGEVDAEALEERIGFLQELQWEGGSCLSCSVVFADRSSARVTRALTM